MVVSATPWWRRPGDACKRILRPGAPDMAAPISLSQLIARAVAHVVAQAGRGGVVLHAPILPRGPRGVSRNKSSQSRRAK